MSTTEQITALEVKLSKLQAEIAGLKYPPNKEWLKKGNTCWVVSASGAFHKVTWQDDLIDCARKSQGNVFRTEAEARHESDRRALIPELRERAGHYKPVWDGNIRNYSLIYESFSKEWKWNWNSMYYTCPRSGYFRAPIERLIEEFGERLNLLAD